MHSPLGQTHDIYFPCSVLCIHISLETLLLTTAYVIITSLRIETWSTMTSISKSKTVAPLSGNPPGYIGNALITIDYPNGLQPSVQSSQLLQDLQRVSLLISLN